MSIKNLWNYMAVSIIIQSIASGCTSTNSKNIIHTYGTADWEPDTLGNHRVLLQVNTESNTARAEIFWRRRDHDPGNKMMISLFTTVDLSIISLNNWEPLEHN